MEEEKEKLTLEEGFAGIEEVIQALSREDIPLEEAFAQYSRGMALLKDCKEQIDRVEKQVLKLTAEGKLEPLDE